MVSIKISFKNVRSTVIEINEDKILIHDISDVDNVVERNEKGLIKKIFEVYNSNKSNVLNGYVQVENPSFNNELLIVDDSTYIFDLNTNLFARNLANEIINCINTYVNTEPEEPVLSNIDLELLKFVDSAEYQKQEINFKWNEKDTLRNVSDESLKLILELMKHSKYRISLVENRIVLDCNIKNVCSKDLTTNQVINNIDTYKSKNMGIFKVKQSLSVDRICVGCKFQRCPKHLLAFIHYLASTNKLVDMLKDRRENFNRNEMYTFNWEYGEIFKYIPEELYNYCDEMNNKRLIYVHRYFPDIENSVSIKSYYNCSDLKLMDLKKEELKEPDVDIEDYKTTIHRPLKKFYITCKTKACVLPGCVLNIASLIQYLKESGRENEILEQRKYYNEHKVECDATFEKMINNQLEEIVGTEDESLEKLNKYQNKLDNFDTLISTLKSSSLRNLFITIEGEDTTLKNDIIADIHNYLFEHKNIENKNLKTISLHNLAASNAYNISSKSGEERDINGVIYNTQDEIRYTVLRRKYLYVINGISDFLKDYNSDGKQYTTLRKKQYSHVLNLLSDITANSYIILNAEAKEIERLFELEPRLQFIYQNNRYIVPEFSLDDTYLTYIGKLNTNLYEKVKQDKEGYKKAFIEYVSLNKNFIPFDNRELASYLAMYSNLKGDVVLPQNIYKRETVDEALQNIIGLDTVKQKVKEFERYMLFKVKAKANNLKIASSNMHMIFTGNPGTGKTTVARIMAKMLYDMGVIKENKLIEVERKDLVASYIGQTAVKTAEVIERAIGGVLFVDEAYTLYNKSKKDFGAEAIATLIKAMEDRKDELVVIFAGYRSEMHDFININPGIASRIGYTFDFPDYSVKELKEIFYKKIDNMGFICSEECDTKLTEICEYFSRRKAFGNGRFVDKLIQATMLKHASSDTDNLELLVEEDIPSIKEFNNNNENDQTTKELLDSIVGMKELKERIIEFEEYVSFIGEANKKNLKVPNQNMHMIFTGNPGTGKTTVARIMAKILYNSGIIHENKLIEVERKDLVGEFNGQTAQKTSDVIDKAMGGVLFIDEAYALSNGSRNGYGAEAIATLIKAMEDHKGEFVVIFAGYKKEMADFVDINPGIASRIGYTFNFTDYTREELAEILYKKINNSGMTIDDKAKDKVSEIMNYFAKVENIGNGRFADKVFQSILLKHAKNKPSDIVNISVKDIPTIKEISNNLFNGDNMINPETITEESLRKTAIHEVGHAFIRYHLYDTPDIVKITINSEGNGSLGYVELKAKEGEYTSTKSKFLNDIMVSLGGMASEEVFLGEFANGNVSDLERATNIARSMVTRFGMSKLGYARIPKVEGELAVIVQNEINEILKECYDKSIKVIKSNKEKMKKVIDYLYEHKEIDEETFIKVFND